MRHRGQGHRGQGHRGQVSVLNSYSIMPKKSRIQSGSGVYHVMMRGINRQRIFEDTEDHYTFLPCLSNAQEQYSPEVERLPNSCHYYAYALMP